MLMVMRVDAYLEETSYQSFFQLTPHMMTTDRPSVNYKEVTVQR